MAEKRHEGAEADLRDTTVGDADVSVGAIVRFGVGLTVVTIVVLALMWVLTKHYARRLAAADPGRGPMAAENPPEAPPGPRLQSDPNREMAELRADEDATLNGYA